MATIAPHVPGAIGKNPAPKEVAIILGKIGNFSYVIGTGLLDLIYHYSLEVALRACDNTDFAMAREASFLIGAKLGQSSKLTI